MDTFVDRLRDIRRLYSIYDVLGLESNKSKLICPLPQHSHSNNTPSFHIFHDPDGHEVFQCFGTCGLKGDVIDLVGYMNLPSYNRHDPKQIDEAIALLGQKIEWHEPAPVRQAPGLAPHAHREYLPPSSEIIEYAADRGLNFQTMAKFSLGSYKHFMSIPIFEEGILTGIKFRNTWLNTDERDFDHLRFWMAKGSKKGLFNYDAVAYKTDPMLFLKGEIPVMLMDQYGILACGLSTGESSLIEQWCSVLSFSDRTVVVGDNDKDPETNKKMVAKAQYRADVVHGRLVFPPAKWKDIDEWCLAEPDVAIPQIKGWLRGEGL